MGTGWGQGQCMCEHELGMGTGWGQGLVCFAEHVLVSKRAMGGLMVSLGAHSFFLAS